MKVYGFIQQSFVDGKFGARSRITGDAERAVGVSYYGGVFANGTFGKSRRRFARRDDVCRCGIVRETSRVGCEVFQQRASDFCGRAFAT